MGMMRSGRAVARRISGVLAAALLVAGCLAPVADLSPSFYADLAAPGATLDRAAARDMINAYRANHDVQPVSVSDRLTELAEAHARELAAAAGRGEEMRPDRNLRARVAEAGYQPDEIGEAISAGYHSIADAFSGWRDSSRHSDVMLMASAREMGIAAVHVPGTRHRIYWVLIMGRPVG
jgi:uncharacterized protein YkwD